jgi:beta-galactosidase/beta-glucuronidase
MAELGNKLDSGRCQELRGPWRFYLDPEDLGEREGWYSVDHDHTAWGAVPVPGAWDLYPHMWSTIGVGWYATEIPAEPVQAGAWQRLRFGRVSIHAKVWLNGEYLGEHLGGYLPFEFPVSPYLSPDRPNLLVLRVDNARRPEWLPAGTVVEWVQYGGILQPVYLITTAATFLSDLRIAAVPEGQGAAVTYRVEVTNRGAARFRGRVTAQAKANGAAEAVSCEPGGTATVSITLHLSQVELWSPESPVLYEATAGLESEGELLDQVSERFGVRTIETRGRQILLNGKPLFVKGFNRYDEYAPYGPVVPESVLREDLQRIKRTGANLVRVHYPQDPKILDIMDEIGLLFMEEVPLNWWGVEWFGKVPEMDHDAVIDAAEHALEDMVRRDKNHPCLVIWSMCNECATETEVGVRAMRRLMRRARELDSTRLVTFVADMDVRGDLAFDEADLVCDNVYYGAFGSRDSMALHIADMDALVRVPTEEHLRRMQEHFGDKPIVVTEFGTRSVPGMHGDAPYTEDHHSAWLEAAWRGITAAPDVAGGVVWSWADYYHQRAFIGHNSPMEQGPFGVVTVDRKPKGPLSTMARLYGGE